MSNEENNVPVYFAQRESTGEFIAIKHGETGFNKTTVYDQAHADVMNERQGITAAMIEAALICSMFNNWNKFDNFIQRFEEKA